MQRIAALTLTLVIIFPLALVAAKWQWSRHLEREHLNVQLEKAISTEPKPLSQISDSKSLSAMEYQSIKIDAVIDSQITWWRKQSLDGIPGFVALVAITENKESYVLALGWSQQPVSMKLDSQISGVARIRIIHSFSSDPSDLPSQQTNSPATVLPQKDTVYLELVSPKFKKLAQIPLPEITAGPHLGYVGQWILIAIFAVAVYVVAIRNLPRT